MRISLGALTGILPIAGLFGIWYGLSTYAGIDPQKLPRIGSVLDATIAMERDGSLKDHISASLYRVSVGFSLTFVTAVPLGLLLGWYSSIGRAFGPLTELMRTISPISWIPIAIIWFGIGDPPAVFILFVSTFFPLLIATRNAVRQIDPLLLRVASDLGASGRRLFASVLVPACVPYIFLGTRISLGIGWLVIVAAEMVGTRSGLGFLISDARYQTNTPALFSGIIIIGLIGLLIDIILFLIGRLLERRGYLQKSKEQA